MNARTILAAIAIAAAAAPAHAAGPAVWYSNEQFDKAVEAAKQFGRPLAVMWQETDSTCPLHNSQRARWKKLDDLQFFICIELDSDKPMPMVVAQLQNASAGKQGRYIPMLFLGNPNGEFLGVVPYKAPDADVTATIRAALKQHGPLLPSPKALALWRKLEEGRKLWDAGQAAGALAAYRELKASEPLNPKLPVFLELRKDEEKLNTKAHEMIDQAKQLLKDNKPAEARSTLTTVCRAFKGFDVAKEAAELLKSTADAK